MEDEKILFSQLEDDEYIGTSVYEVKEIPDISIITKDPQEEYSIKHKKQFESLLTEIYYNCKQNFEFQLVNQNFAIEFAFVSEPAKNQTYKADVKIYIVIRVIDWNKDNIKLKQKQIYDSIKTTLDFNKYDLEKLENTSEIIQKIKDIACKEKQAITKDFKIENLQSNFLPECFSFEKLPEKNQNFTKVINTLMQYPNCAVIFDLIPTTFMPTEIDNIEKMSNMLDMLEKGTTGAEVNITNTIAEKYAEVYKYYERNKRGVLFSYNILICAPQEQVTSITTKIMSDISIGENNEYANLRYYDIGNYELDVNEYFNALPWVINEITLEKAKLELNNPFLRMAFVITGEEASQFFRIPYGDEDLTAGVNINLAEKTARKYHKNVINTGDIFVGRLKSSTNGDRVGIELDDLTKHMLVVGTPGSGKSTFSVGLLDTLWKEHHIPFLVIEPAKNEYRAMIDSIPDIQVFTPGKDFISPYILNPFIPPKNVRLQSYKSYLKTAFSAAIDMSTPLDKIFEDTIDECYSRAGWLPYYTIDDGGKIFTMQDFIKTFLEVFETIGYKGDASNIGKAGYVRLKSLSKLFETYYTVPIEDLLKKPTIIELAAIENEEQKSLLIALLLLNIQAYVTNNYIGKGNLKNVILLEEAHVLLGSAEKKKSDDEANPSAVAKNLLIRMLAEMRSLGVGIVIADQSPEAVTAGVIRFTTTKIAFNIVEKADRDILANSTTMKEIHNERLANLRVGEAFFYTNGLDNPEEIITENYRAKMGIRTTISDEEIARKTTYWNNKKDMLKPFKQCKCAICCNNGCDYKIKEEAREYARRIFVKNFNQESKDKKLLVDVYKTMSDRIKEVAGKQLDKKTQVCTKLQFLRKVKYETKIDVSDELIENTIKKEFKGGK